MDHPAVADVFGQLLADLDLPRVPQQARSRQKRDALLAAAGHLFAERGYEATTADDIAAAAEVSIGTFYSYFRNKRQVFLTLYATCVQSIAALGIDQVDLTGDRRAAIRQMIGQAMDRDALFHGLQRAWHELLPRDAEVASYNMRFNQGIYQQVLAATSAAAAAGLTWPDLLLEETCWMITLLLDLCWRTSPPPAQQSPAEKTRRLEALTDLIYRSLFQPE